MNEENGRKRRMEEVETVEHGVRKITKDELRKALKRMKGPDDIKVEVWKCLGEVWKSRF